MLQPEGRRLVTAPLQLPVPSAAWAPSGARLAGPVLPGKKVPGEEGAYQRRRN